MANKRQHAVSWFEIPATDLHRATAFYQTIFGIEMVDFELPNGLKMALFPTGENGVGGAICQHKDFYFPGNKGPVVYLNANPDLQTVLSKIESAGGKVLVPKTQISPENGFMAVYEDCEGNRMALHSVA